MTDRGHLVFHVILNIVAQKLFIGLCFYMGEAGSDVSKNRSYRIAIQTQELAPYMRTWRTANTKG